MSVKALWKDISTELARDISRGHFASGDKLPTELELAGRFGVNRHTVRKALADLADQHLVWSKRGSGVFVTGQKTKYVIGRRMRFHQNIQATGRTPTRETLQIEKRPPNEYEIETLRLPNKGLVHVFEGISKSDNVPIALFRSVFDASRFSDLDKYLTKYHSVTQALKACGLHDYTRSLTQITAVLATPVQANHLQIAPGDPLLRATSINSDLSGVPVELGRTYFVGDRVQFVHGDEMSRD
ncbi:MAG: phosphonate metabolism transcriptional regulator PhnF [Rhodobacteraceae bacterium]|jgi:GntR family phosphonate transport system transcriptional regulator|nr:phosphonate metabolism transcriptional regulator PhnF [Paracoccaceae bacterium]